MSNTLLIGKDLPDCLEIAEAITANGRQLFTSAKSSSETTKFESENIFASTWNKSSAVSAHSLLINAETKLNNIDEVIFYFDASYFCTHFELDKSEEVSQGSDSMINSYLYFVNELLKRADQKKENLLISFLIKEHPSKAENAIAKTPSTIPASNIVSAAQAAFISLAENVAALVEERPYLSVLLSRCNLTNELYKNEKLIADWLCEGMNTIHNQKNKQTVKQALTWNKAGSKVQTGFALFK